MPRVDMNFIFKWSTRYLMSESREFMRYRFEHEKIKFISISKCVIFCLLYKHQWNTKSACFQRRDLICNHNDDDLFTYEDNMLSSRVKIWSVCGKAHLVFHWCLYNNKGSYAMTKVMARRTSRIFIKQWFLHMRFLVSVSRPVWNNYMK